MAAGTPEWPTVTTEGAWFKIATGITTGTLERLKSNYAMWLTYVATTDPAPTIDPLVKSRKLFQNSSIEELSFSASVDVYIYLDGTDVSVTETNIANSIQVNI